MRTAFVVLSAVLIVTLIAVVYLASSGQVTDIYTVTYQTAIQLLVISLTGHLVTVLVSRLNQEREETRAKDEFRRNIIAKLNECYIEVKKLRRLTRATNTPSKGGYPQAIRVEDYYPLLEEINEVQLRIEILSKEVEAFQGIFAKHQELQSHVDAMEEYLNELINEFEHTSRTPTGKPPSLALKSLPKLADFLGSYSDSRFRTHFVKTYYSALDIVRAELLYAGRNYSAKRPNQEKSA